MNIEITQQLQKYYQDHAPDLENVAISAVQKIAAGWESEIIAFTLTHGNANNRVSQELVLRRFPSDVSGERATIEFSAIARLNEIGYPAPLVFASAQADSPFQMPAIIMERLSGGDMWDYLDQTNDETYSELLATLSQLMTQLHQLDWRIFSDPKDWDKLENPYAFVDRWLNIANQGHAHFPNSGLLPVLDWIQARRDDFYCPKPAPVHNDFHPGNVFISPNRKPVVIDWTGFNISDPRFDLGWTLMLLYAYQGAKARDLMRQEYERCSQMNLVNLPVFEVFACTRRIFDLSISLNLGAEAHGLHPNAIAAMQKQKNAHERVYQILKLHTGIRVPEFEKILADL